MFKNHILKTFQNHSLNLIRFATVVCMQVRVPFHFLPNTALLPNFSGRTPPAVVLEAFSQVCTSFCSLLLWFYVLRSGGVGALVYQYTIV